MPVTNTAQWLAALEREAAEKFQYLSGIQQRSFAALFVDAFISARLAVAIGWDAREDLRVQLPMSWSPNTVCEVWTGDVWWPFSYKDPTVVIPIAEKYGITSASVTPHGGQTTWTARYGQHTASAESEFKAIALVLIAATNADATWTREPVAGKLVAAHERNGTMLPGTTSCL